MPYPDGSYLNAMPLRTSTIVPLATDPNGNAAVTITADDWKQFVLLPESINPANYAVTWGGNSFTPNVDTNGLTGSTAAYRLLACSMCVDFIGNSLADGGSLTTQVYAPAWQQLANGEYDSALVNFPVTKTPQFMHGPLREGAELVLAPLDPRSRTYQLVDPSTSTDAATLELQEQATDKWPVVTFMVNGALASANMVEIRVVCDWEIQPAVGTLASRVTRPPNGDNPAMREAIASVYKGLEARGATIASKLAVSAAGGMYNYFATTIGAAAGRIGRGALNIGLAAIMGGGARAVPSRYSNRITEL